MHFFQFTFAEIPNFEFPVATELCREERTGFLSKWPLLGELRRPIVARRPRYLFRNVSNCWLANRTWTRQKEENQSVTQCLWLYVL